MYMPCCMNHSVAITTTVLFLRTPSIRRDAVMTDLRSAFSASVCNTRSSSHLISPALLQHQHFTKTNLLKNNNDIIITHVPRAGVLQWWWMCNVNQIYLHTVIRFLLSTALIRATAFLRAPLNPRFNDAMIAVYFLTSFFLFWCFGSVSSWLTLTGAIELE